MENETETPVEQTAETGKEVVDVSPVEEGAAKTEVPPVEEGADGTEVVKPKPKQTAQERINEVVKARREEEREKNYWKNIALQNMQAVKPVESSIPVVTSAPVRPDIKDFESSNEYEDALVEWHLQKTEAVKIQAEQTKEAAKVEARFLEKAEKLKAEFPDFMEVVNAPVYSPIMKEVLFNSENGALIAYHLGLPENNVIAAQIRNLSPRNQVYELGKLETQLLLAQKANKRTNAPPPIEPLNTGFGAELNKDTSKMSDDEYYKYDDMRRKEAILRKYSKKL